MVDPEAVHAYIDAHLPDLTGPPDIADALGVPYETLRKDYKRATGACLRRCLTERRLARMRALLRETDLPCAEVAHAVGLAREDTAARLFKRETGQTMTAFRRQARGG